MDSRQSTAAVVMAILAASPVSAFHLPALPRASGPWGTGEQASLRTASQPLQLLHAPAGSTAPAAAAWVRQPMRRQRSKAWSTSVANDDAIAATMADGTMSALSQTPELDPLPLPPHPGLVQGVLPNGLR